MVSAFNLPGWQSTTTTILIGLIPEQNFDSANTLVSNYLSSVGGWIPDNSGDPTGLGTPANMQSPSSAANSISQIEYSRVYDSNVTVTFQVNLQFLQKLASGLTQQQVLSAIQETVANQITQIIANSSMPMTVMPNTFSAISGTLAGNGLVTSAERLAIVSEIAAGGKLLDYKAIALAYAQKTYLLDANWNVSRIYTDINLPICIEIGRYSDTTFNALDPNTSQRYLITLNPQTYAFTSAIKLPVF